MGEGQQSDGTREGRRRATGGYHHTFDSNGMLPCYELYGITNFYPLFIIIVLSINTNNGSTIKRSIDIAVYLFFSITLFLIAISICIVFMTKRFFDFHESRTLCLCNSQRFTLGRSPRSLIHALTRTPNADRSPNHEHTLSTVLYRYITRSILDTSPRPCVVKTVHGFKCCYT